MLGTWRAGGFSIEGIEEATTFEDGRELDVPGSPTTVHVPGHAVGRTAFWLSDRRVLIAGDAVVTIDVITGRSGDPTVGECSEADVEQAKRSTRRLAVYGGVTLLPGHGPPWTGDLRDALATDASERAAVSP